MCVITLCAVVSKPSYSKKQGPLGVMMSWVGLAMTVIVSRCRNDNFICDRVWQLLIPSCFLLTHIQKCLPLLFLSVLVCVVESAKDELPLGYYAFEVMHGKHNKPPQVKKPPYLISDHQCPGKRNLILLCWLKNWRLQFMNKN